MKIEILTLTFALISITSVFGQDYQTVNSKRIAYFESKSNSDIKCIRIDSVKYQIDSILYPFTVIQELNDYCISPSIASWIGKKVIVNEKGENQFFNKFNDMITLKTKAGFGDKWIAYRIIDSLIIEATVIGHDTMNFLGRNDSVKTIGFQAYDKNMNPLDFGINKMTIQISKNYGFVKTFNFYLFPNFQSRYLKAWFEEYSLIGLSNPKVGVQNLTWFEINDYQPGDELHILDESSSWYGVGNRKGSATTDKAIYKYLIRTDYSDSIVYVYSRKQSIYTTWTDSSSFKFYNDTIKTTIKPDSAFDKLPGEPIFIEKDLVASNYHMTNEIPITKTNPGGWEIFVHSHDSCWSMITGEGCLTKDKYLKGLGGPYYYCRNYDALGGKERKLVYYKKGDTIWGSPLVVTGISDIKNSNNIRIYPNPAGDYINILFEGNKYSDYFIYVYDIQGKLLKYQKLDLNDSKINVSDLGTGIYIIKLTDNEKVLKTDRLIIE